MLNASRAVLVVLSTLAVATACERRGELVAPRPTPAVAAAARRPPYPGEASQAALAEQIPGFGGYAFDREGNLNVFLTDLAQTQVAMARLAPLLQKHEAMMESQRRNYDRQTTGPGAGPPRRRPPAGPGRIVVKQGRFAWLDLSDWRDLIAAKVLTMRGWTSLGIDERNNRVLLGVQRDRIDALRPVIEKRLDALGIPRAAVLIHEAGPFVPDDGRGPVRPAPRPAKP